MTEQQYKEQICDVGHKLWQLGFVAANDGNISVKLDEDTFLSTPTGKQGNPNTGYDQVNSRAKLLKAMKITNPHQR